MRAASGGAEAQAARVRAAARAVSFMAGWMVAWESGGRQMGNRQSAVGGWRNVHARGVTRAAPRLPIADFPLPDQRAGDAALRVSDKSAVGSARHTEFGVSGSISPFPVIRRQRFRLLERSHASPEPRQMP